MNKVQLAAQKGNICLDVVAARIGVVAPHLDDDILLGDDALTVGEQQLENFGLLKIEVDALAGRGGVSAP